MNKIQRNVQNSHDLDKFFLTTEESYSGLDEIATRRRRRLIIVIVMFFLIFACWTWITRIDISALASGRIVPSGQVKVIQSPLLGKISAIYVNDGQQVSAGQILIELDAENIKLEKERLNTELMIAKVEEARIQALIQTDDDRSFDLPSNIPPEIARINRRLLMYELSENERSKASGRKAIKEQKARIKTIEALSEKSQSMLGVLREELKAREATKQGGFGTKLDYLETLSDVVEQEKERNFQLRRVEEEKSKLETMRAEGRTKGAGAARFWLGKLANVQSQILIAEKKLKTISRHEENHKISAPQSGTVQDLSVHTIGGVVSVGDSLMVIVPDNSTLEIEALVPNKDIAFVKPGQVVDIRFRSFPFTRYGSIKGELQHVSKDATNVDLMSNTDIREIISTSNRAQNDGLFYKALIKLEQSTLNISGENIRIVPGMIVDISIRTGNQRVFEFFLAPIFQYRDKAFRER